MACNTCRQNRCVCDSGNTAALGISVEVTAVPGSPENSSELAGLLPCDSTSCTSTPADPNVCCNYFTAREGINGDSFFYSAGGPFKVTQNSPGVCPVPVASLIPLPAPSTGFQDPGILDGVVCANLTPGTYNFSARFELHDGTPGTRVVVLYRPNCDVATEEYLVSDCSAPCGNCTGGGSPPAPDTISNFNMLCSNFLVVQNPTCNPGFRILALGGRKQAACIGSGDFTQPYIRNVQLLIEKVTSRDLVNCNTSALIPGVLPNTGPPI